MNSKLIETMSPERDVKPYSCETCGKSYKKRGTLNRHKKNHTGIKPHKCIRCGDVFTLKDFLKMHMLTHYDNNLLDQTAKRKETKITGRTRLFANEEGDNATDCNSKRRYARSKLKIFPCPRCNLSFSRRDNLNSHISVHIKTIAFKCADMCSFETYSESTIQEHVATHPQYQAYTIHEVIYKPFKCTQCTMRFSRKSGLLTHKRVHEDVKRFACKLCDYQSSWVTRMKLHALTHINK